MYLTGTAQVLNSNAIQLTAQLLGNQLAAGEDCDILQHCLSAIAEARSLDCQSPEGTAQLVYNDSSQSLAIKILSYNNQLLAHLYNLLQDWQDVVYSGNLLIGNQDERIVHYCFHLVSVSNHVRGNIAAIELHALNYREVGLHTLGLLYSDNAFLAYLLHCICNVLADFLISGGNGSNLSDCFLGLYRLGNGLDFLNQSLNCSLNTLLQNHWVCTSSNVSHTLMNHSLRQESSGGGTVTSDVVGLGSNLAYQLCAHVLKWILQLDVTSDGNTIIGDGRCTELLVQYYVAALWSKGNLYSIC